MHIDVYQVSNTFLQLYRTPYPFGVLGTGESYSFALLESD